METKILIIGVIKKDRHILMRKKPDGSLPYKETWYSFGAELKDDQTPQETFTEWVGENLAITIKVKETLGWDTEVKNDHDGKTKRFIYLDILCGYIDGNPKIPEGAEKVAWIPIDKLGEYDIVPPSVKLFKKLGYL